MNEFEKALLKFYSAEKLAKIQNLKVGIAGAGGLGSNIALNLVRSGFKNFEIVDFDTINYSNLNRQYFFINEIGQSKIQALTARMKLVNPDCRINGHQQKISYENAAEYFKDADILFEAFDRPENKKMFLESYADGKRLLIMGNGMAGSTNEREIKIRKINDRLFVVGDEVSSIADLSVYAPRVSVCAGLMAAVGLEYSLR